LKPDENLEEKKDQFKKQALIKLQA